MKSLCSSLALSVLSPSGKNVLGMSLQSFLCCPLLAECLFEVGNALLLWTFDALLVEAVLSKGSWVCSWASWSSRSLKTAQGKKKLLGFVFFNNLLTAYV